MSTAVRPAQPGPERSRLPIFYPSQIKEFLDCPERYFHKRVARTPAPEPFSRPLARGIATHAVLAGCFARFRADRTLPTDLPQRVAAELRATGYPPALAASWDDDAADVLAFVRWALGWFDGDAEVLGVEETLGYHHRGDPACGAFLLRAKVDLVLSYPDGALEHVDVKTGRAQRDPVQEVAARVVVGQAFGERFPTVRTTTLFVAEQAAATEVLDRGASRGTWQTIKGAVNGIMTATSFPPKPSPLCGFCPYFGQGCSAAPAADDAGAVAAWLGDAPA